MNTIQVIAVSIVAAVWIGVAICMALLMRDERPEQPGPEWPLYLAACLWPIVYAVIWTWGTAILLLEHFERKWPPRRP
jgi:hypothetical protein